MPAPSYAHSRSGESRVLNWQKDVAKSTASHAYPEPPNTTRVIVNHITTPTVVISRPASTRKEETEISTRAIIGTLLGASAGAVVAYAMVRGDHEDRQYQEARHPIKRVTETAVVVRPPLADFKNRQYQHSDTYDIVKPRSHYDISGPRVETVVSTSRSYQQSATLNLRPEVQYAGSHSGHTIIQTRNGTKVLTSSTQSRSSHASSRSKKEKHLASVAEDPLPQSRSSAVTTKHETVIPDDSISQVSTNRPRDRERSSHQLHYDTSRSEHRHRRSASHAGSSTVRSDRHRAGSSRY